jgi:hypothetical protein
MTAVMKTTKVETTSKVIGIMLCALVHHTKRELEAINRSPAAIIQNSNGKYNFNG